MKLIRIGEVGKETPGILGPNGKIYDLRSLVNDFDEKFWESDLPSQLEAMSAEEIQKLPTVEGDLRLGPPVARPGKIICIGLNYSDHARESNMAIPDEPVVFFKASSAICGPFDDIVLPPGSEKTDWEVELAFVIGKKAKHVSKEEAMDHVGGYLLHNDVSERAFQLEMGGQWVKGKSYDNFAPLGPWLVTPDEISDPHNLSLWLEVNGERVQNGNTNTMIFDIPEVISYLSRFMTLMPGDIISTGTPPGVGLGFDPPRYLKEGDVVELGIEGLGTSRQVVKAF